MNVESGAAPEWAIELEHVRKDLLLGSRKSQTAVTIIPDMSLQVPMGEFLAITGPSGSGKSTVLYLMGGLDRPSAGRVLLLGQDAEALTEQELTRLRSKTIGFVYQFHFLLPEFSALENVMMPLYAAGGAPMKEAKARARELLELTGLGDKLDHRPNQLSGGQQQRVAIARALANDPPLLLADEPTGNLDSAAAESVFAVFRELNRQGRTVVVVTHERHFAEYARRVLLLVDGKIAEDRPGKNG